MENQGESSKLCVDNNGITVEYVHRTSKGSNLNLLSANPKMVKNTQTIRRVVWVCLTIF